MRLLICGSRRFTDYNKLLDTLMFDWKHDEITHIIEGGAKGADELAYRYAKHAKIPFSEYPAQWDKHGRAAGPIRNQQMLDEGKPDHVLAFMTKTSKGTRDMVTRAEKAKIPVTIIDIEI